MSRSATKAQGGMHRPRTETRGRRIGRLERQSASDGALSESGRRSMPGKRTSRAKALPPGRRKRQPSSSSGSAPRDSRRRRRSSQSSPASAPFSVPHPALSDEGHGFSRRAGKKSPSGGHGVECPREERRGARRSRRRTTTRSTSAAEKVTRAIRREFRLSRWAPDWQDGASLARSIRTGPRSRGSRGGSEASVRDSMRDAMNQGRRSEVLGRRGIARRMPGITTRAPAPHLISCSLAEVTS